MATYKKTTPFVARVRLDGEAPPRRHSSFNDTPMPAPIPPMRAGAGDFLRIKSKGVRT